MRGRFITFEGGEGVGKSTQVRRLAARLGAAGIRAVSTREPGGSPRAEALRACILSGAAKPFGPLAEAVMFSAARASHLDATIRPALARGDWVLSDRFSDSTRAYQGSVGALRPELVRALERVVVGTEVPDLTLILDAPASVGLRRAASRRSAKGERADRFEAEAESFHDRLRQAFLAIAAAEPERCVVIDANREPDAVEADIWAAIERRAKRSVDHGTGRAA